MYDATGTQGTNAQMLYTCPHCQGRFEFNTESLVRQIFCPLCGQGFDPVKIETMRYPEGTPVSPSPGAPLAPSPGAAPETIQAANKDEKLRVGTRLGQFRIDEFIGRGGMGAVYKATQTSLDRAVALKVLPRHMAEDPEFVQRFHREAKALAELNHPNIVSIYDKGNEEGQYFFAMEFVEGVSLRQLIKSKTVNPSQALALVPQLCEALEYAHSRGVIHRDIKPENILVDRSGRVKIADFGLARIIRGDDQTTFNGLTRSDVMMGTVNYMAPEQRENAKDVDHRADIYSLGVVIYELLTGDLPIGRFAAPSKKVQIDVRLDEVVLQLLERDREDRYQNVSDVKTGFARAMSEPQRPSAAPAAPQEPLPWWVRSIPGGFLGLLGTAIVIAGIWLLTGEGTTEGTLSALIGFALLTASFWIDHGHPAPGARVRPAETAGGFVMLGLMTLAIGFVVANAVVNKEGTLRFWEMNHSWPFVFTSLLAFVGLEGLSSHVKVRSERGPWVGTVLNVTNLFLLLLGFTATRVVPSHPSELAFQLMLGYPIAAAAVFGLGWWVAGARRAAVVAPRAAGRGALAFTLLGSLLLLTAAVLATVQLVDEVAHPWPFAWGTGEIALHADGWSNLISVKEMPARYWLSRHEIVYGVLAAACLGLLALSTRLRTRSGSGLAWTGVGAAVAIVAGGSTLVAFSSIEPRDWIARLVAALAPSVGLVAFGVLWVAARRSDRGLYGIERELESPVDRWAVRVFQAGTFLWIAYAVATALVGRGSDDARGIVLFSILAAPVLLFGVTAIRRIGGAEDGRTGMRYAVAGAAAACVFPLMHATEPFSLGRYMETTFCSAWLFVAFALCDAALRPSQRLGKYFGLGGALERRAWLAAILGTAAIGGLFIAFDYRTVNRGDNVLLAATPFVGAIAYIFLVAWGIPLPASGKECESECPILDKGVSIEANCPSGAGVSIHLGTSAPPVPSTPPTSTPPPPPSAATVPGIPSAEEIKAQVRAAIAGIPSAEEIKAQVRASLQASGIPVAQVAPAPSEKALRKGWNRTRSMWRDALWHAGAYTIIAGGFALAGKWGWWLFFWGCIVGGQFVSTVFRTIANPPHRPATTPQAQKRRKELSGFLQHLSWFAAIMTGFAYPEMRFPSWGIWWGIGLAFHFLSTILDVAFGKETA